MPAQEFGGTVIMAISLKLVILPKEFYIRESHKNISGSTDVLFYVYIITTHLTKYSSIFFQGFINISKINHTKKEIEDLNVLRNILGLDKKLVMKFKQVFLLLNVSFKLPLKIIYLVRKNGKIILVE